MRSIALGTRRNQDRYSFIFVKLGGQGDGETKEMKESVRTCEIEINAMMKIPRAVRPAQILQLGWSNGFSEEVAFKLRLSHPRENLSVHPKLANIYWVPDTCQALLRPFFSIGN